VAVLVIGRRRTAESQRSHVGLGAQYLALAATQVQLLMPRLARRALVLTRSPDILRTMDS
jgi:hypothetical protein